MIHEDRVRKMNTASIADGRYVLYWMQASQRAVFNHALEYSIDMANKLERTLVVYFGLTDCYPEANERHYMFMLEGLRDVSRRLESRGIGFVVRRESPEQGALRLSRDAILTVVDTGYLRHQRDWRRYVTQRAHCPVLQVESDVVVPVQSVSDKEQYSAGTIRPRIHRLLDSHLLTLTPRRLNSQTHEHFSDSIELADLSRVLSEMKIDREVKPVSSLRGGTSEALDHLESFVNTRLEQFGDLRNDPSLQYLSDMSPYLHFGQVSPLQIALRALEQGGEGCDKYLEELIVRRELSMNFVYYNQNYDSIACLPDWARTTLRKHTHDRRDYQYTIEELENAATHDDYWNAAQREMVKFGKMHGYMRMYWGKKIIEWTASPETAFRTAVCLNNKYELDGRDPNGYAGIAWCFGKHDRAWSERPIFGKVRYMNDRGLERKFDIEKYVRRVGP